MAITLGNLSYKNETICAMIKALEVKRPAIDSLQVALNEKEVDKNRQTVREICDFLEI